MLRIWWFHVYIIVIASFYLLFPSFSFLFLSSFLYVQLLFFFIPASYLFRQWKEREEVDLLILFQRVAGDVVNLPIEHYNINSLHWLAEYMNSVSSDNCRKSCTLHTPLQCLLTLDGDIGQSLSSVHDRSQTLMIYKLCLAKLIDTVFLIGSNHILSKIEQ